MFYALVAQWRQHFGKALSDWEALATVTCCFALTSSRTHDSAVRVRIPLSTSLAISFGTDPYLGNEIVCCACDEENDLKCF